MNGAESCMQATTPRNGHGRQLPDMSARRLKRGGRGSVLRPLTRRITNRIVSDALRYEVPTLSRRLLSA
jgi:predicted TIM-barrel enzyme